MQENPFAKMKPVRWTRRHPFWTIVLLFAAITIVLSIVKFASDWPAFHQPVPQAIQDAAKGNPDLIGTANVYDFWGNFIDRQHLWRVQMSPELIPILVKKFGLIEVDSADEVPKEFWQQQPYWWRPSRSGRFFISPGFQADRRGADGDHFLMMYDESTSVIYVWYKNNF
jgi:hypothetical protein